MGSWGFRKILRFGRSGRVTIGKKSVGTSIGIGPLRIGVNSRGTARSRVTIPGTGLYYEERSRIGSPRSRSKSRKVVWLWLFAIVIVVVALVRTHIL
jgi:hypothetical protein